MNATYKLLFIDVNPAVADNHFVRTWLGIGKAIIFLITDSFTAVSKKFNFPSI